MSDGDRHLIDPAFPGADQPMCDVTATGTGTHYPAQVTCEACQAARLERRDADPDGYTVDHVLRAEPGDVFAPEAGTRLVGTRVPFKREDGRRMKVTVTSAVVDPDGRSILMTLHSPDWLTHATTGSV